MQKGWTCLPSLSNHDIKIAHNPRKVQSFISSERAFLSQYCPCSYVVTAHLYERLIRGGGDFVTRPDQLRKVFALLCAEFPDEPVWQLLQLAYYILKAHREPETYDFDEGGGRSPFFALDVTEALKDGGWKVLDFERRQGMSFGDEMSDSHDRAQSRLRRLIGRTSWPRSGTD
jgi:hypothetical protein